MGLGLRLGKMWAGVIDDHIAATPDQSRDDYTPVTVALFRTKAEAQQFYERVVEVDADALFRVAKK
jgi:hypothetical protein